MAAVRLSINPTTNAPNSNTGAARRNPSAAAVVGDVEEIGDLFPPGSFQLVACRDLVHHLRHPLRAFRNWHRWLVPGGRVAVIDAFWLREDWNGDWAAFADTTGRSAHEAVEQAELIAALWGS